MDVLYPKSEIIGCYESSELENSMIQIDEQEFRLRGEPLYTEYTYGIAGRALVPFAYASPPLALRVVRDELRAVPIPDRDPADAKSVIFENAGHTKVLKIATYPNARVYRLRRVQCPV